MADNIKGIGDVFVETIPFRYLEDAAKTAFKELLNGLSSVNLEVKSETALCAAGAVLDASLASPNQVQQKRREGTATRGDKEGTRPKKCCKQTKYDAIVSGVKKLKFSLRLKFAAVPIFGFSAAEGKVDFDLVLTAQAEGEDKDWQCPGICQRDKISADLFLIVSGKLKMEATIAGFAGGEEVEVDWAINLGRASVQCTVTQ